MNEKEQQELLPNFVCVRHEKIRNATGIILIEKEAKREDEFANRDNVQPELTPGNQFAGNTELSMYEICKERKQNFEKVNGRKIRKDVVGCISTVFTFTEGPKDSTELHNMMYAAIAAYQKSINRALKKAGSKDTFRDVPMKVWGHCDEFGQPHVHVMIVPITKDGKAFAGYLTKRNEMRKIQDYFTETAQEQGFDVVRGISNEERLAKGEEIKKHLDNWKFFKSEEGQKWLAQKTEEIEQLKEEEKTLKEQIKVLKERRKNFVAAFDGKEDLNALLKYAGGKEER